MARKTPSRLELRKQVEAAAAYGGGDEKKKTASKKAATPRAKRAKEKAIARKRLVWVVYNGSMKEEARFPYDQRAAAEEKIEQLKLKSNKKLYFIQPVKEIIGEAKGASVGLVEELKPARKKASRHHEEAEDEFLEEDEEEDEDEEDEEEDE